MKPKHYIITILILVSIVSFFFLNIIAKKNQEIKQIAESITDYNFIVSNQIDIISNQTETIANLEEKLSRTQLVKVSFYHPASRGINSDSDPTNTATMRRPTVGRTIAISDELFNDGWLGFKIYIDRHGVFVAEDRMGVDENGNPIKGKQIDICVSSEAEAFRLGIRHNVVAVKL